MEDKQVFGGTFTLVGYKVEVKVEVGEPLKLLDNIISESWREFRMTSENSHYIPIIDTGVSSNHLRMQNLFEHEQAMFVAWAIRMHLGPIKKSYVSIRIKEYSLNVKYSYEETGKLFDDLSKEIIDA
jgi:hypothetical protein